MDTSKRCTGCNQIKLFTEYYPNKRGKGGVQWRCKKCSLAYINKWHRKNPRKYRYGGWLKAKYGIVVTLEDYNKMSAAQDGVCAICQKVDKTGRRLAVDHDHNTGEIRGLLCGRCNRLLGQAEKDLPRIEGLIAYYKRFLNRGAAPEHQTQVMTSSLLVSEGPSRLT